SHLQADGPAADDRQTLRRRLEAPYRVRSQHPAGTQALAGAGDRGHEGRRAGGDDGATEADPLLLRPIAPLRAAMRIFDIARGIDVDLVRAGECGEPLNELDLDALIGLLREF